MDRSQGTRALEHRPLAGPNPVERTDARGSAEVARIVVLWDWKGNFCRPPAGYAEAARRRIKDLRPWTENRLS
jgi:hypothetical protein